MKKKTEAQKTYSAIKKILNPKVVYVGTKTRIAPLGNVPVAPTIPKDHLKTCTNILIGDMVKLAAKKMRTLKRVTNYKTGYSFTPDFLKPAEPKKIILKCQSKQCTNNNQRRKSGCNKFKDTGKCSRMPDLKENVVTNMEFCLGKNALLPYTKEDLLPKKKRILTRFNAKKTYCKHTVLWNTIKDQVRSDIFTQTGIYNKRFKRLPELAVVIPEIADNVAENAAFTAIVEMIKRELL